MISSIIPYLLILYPHMGPSTTPGPHVPHHLNQALQLPIESKIPVLLKIRNC